MEETGYDVRVTGITRVMRYISQHGFHCVRFNFIAEIIGGAPAVDGAEILAHRWYTFDEIAGLPDDALRTAHVARQVLEDVRDGRCFPMEIFLDSVKMS